MLKGLGRGCTKLVKILLDPLGHNPVKTDHQQVTCIEELILVMEKPDLMPKGVFTQPLRANGRFFVRNKPMRYHEVNILNYYLIC